MSFENSFSAYISFIFGQLNERCVHKPINKKKQINTPHIHSYTRKRIIKKKLCKKTTIIKYFVHERKIPTINLTVNFFVRNSRCVNLIAWIFLINISLENCFHLINGRVSASPWVRFNVCVYICVSIFHLRDHKTCILFALHVFRFISFVVVASWNFIYLEHWIPWMLATITCHILYHLIRTRREKNKYYQQNSLIFGADYTKHSIFLLRFISLWQYLFGVYSLRVFHMCIIP